MSTNQLVMTNVEKSCVDLDLLIVKYFETFSELCDLKHQLECTMKSGFLYMAKARYSMGSNAVSSLQYNENDLSVAMVHVDVATQYGDAVKPQQFLPVFSSSLTVTSENAQGDIGEHKSALSDANDDDLSSSVSHLNIGLGVRKRNVVPAGEIPESGAGDDVKLNAISKSSVEDIKSKDAVYDPIRWFGVLVPLPLRQSQQSFRNGIELACKVASLQSRLIDIRQSYVDLLQEKRRLISASS